MTSCLASPLLRAHASPVALMPALLTSPALRSLPSPTLMPSLLKSPGLRSHPSPAMMPTLLTSPGLRSHPSPAMGYLKSPFLGPKASPTGAPLLEPVMEVLSFAEVGRGSPILRPLAAPATQHLYQKNVALQSWPSPFVASVTPPVSASQKIVSW